MCDVCIGTFNLSTRRQVTCPYCPFKVCTQCSEKYLCQTSEDPHCMSCRHGFTIENLSCNFTKTFINQTYKLHREELLFEREKARMPDTQPFVEIERELRNLVLEKRSICEQILSAERKIEGLFRILPKFEDGLKHNILQKEYKKHLYGLKIDLEAIHWHTEWLKAKANGFDNHNNPITRHKREFIRSCPTTDCKGFLDTEWSCGLCDIKTCKNCLESIQENHECTESNVQTAKLLNKDSKGCPKCASLIFKISGCDQMYCTRCHTAFSWNTGRVETGIMHNPHFFEYNRARGNIPRQMGDVVCGGFPTWHTISRLFDKANPLYQDIVNAYLSYGNVMYHHVPRYRQEPVNNQDIRIKLMIGDLPEREFKRKIQQREKARNRKFEICQVLEMYCAVVLDLFQKLDAENDPEHPSYTDIDINFDLMELITSMETLTKHVNSSFTSISKQFTHCVVPWVNGSYLMI